MAERKGEEMKFKIGDEVLHRSMIVEMESHIELAVAAGNEDRLPWPKVFIVTHSFVETCHGGCQQVAYQVSSATAGTHKWPEEFMVHYDEWVIDRILDGWKRIQQNKKEKP